MTWGLERLTAELLDHSLLGCDFLFRFLRSLRRFPKQLRHVHDPDVPGSFPRIDAIFHHRHAKRASHCEHVSAPVSRIASRARSWFTRWSGRLFDKAHPATAAAAETLVAAALHLDGLRDCGDLLTRLPRRVVDSILPAQVAGIMKGDLLLQNATTA